MSRLLQAGQKVNLAGVSSISTRPRAAYLQPSIQWTTFSKAMERVVIATPDSTREEKIKTSLSSILAENGGKWNLTSDGKGIKRTVRFKTFKQATAFMTEMFPKIAEARHHPSLTNTYNTVELLWTTHKDRNSGMAGISELDVEMAKTGDEIADSCGAINE